MKQIKIAAVVVVGIVVAGVLRAFELDTIATISLGFVGATVYDIIKAE